LGTGFCRLTDWQKIQKNNTIIIKLFICLRGCSGVSLIEPGTTPNHVKLCVKMPISSRINKINLILFEEIHAFRFIKLVPIRKLAVLYDR
jgi:hypothetical protein